MTANGFELARVPTATVLGRKTSGLGPLEALTISELKTLLALAASDISFSTLGTGAIARTVALKLDDILHPADYGCVCDGVTDDTANLQLALNVARSSSMRILTSVGRATNRPSLASPVPTIFSPSSAATLQSKISGSMHSPRRAGGTSISRATPQILTGRLSRISTRSTPGAASATAAPSSIPRPGSIVSSGAGITARVSTGRKHSLTALSTK
jgi:hypothetical protein